MASEKPKTYMSLAAYARRRGVSGNAVTNAIQSGRLPRSTATRKGKTVILDVVLADQEWAENTRPAESTAKAAAAVAVAGMPSVGVSRARLEAARATVAELDLQERQGELVSSADARAAVVEKFIAVRTKLLGLAVRTKQRLPHLSANDVDCIDSLVREALSELAGE